MSLHEFFHAVFDLWERRRLVGKVFGKADETSALPQTRLYFVLGTKRSATVFMQ